MKIIFGLLISTVFSVQSLAAAPRYIGETIFGGGAYSFRKVSEIIKGDPRFSLLTELLEESGLLKAADGLKTAHTFFLPSNSYLFRQFTLQQLAELRANQQALRAFLGNHVAPGQVFATDAIANASQNQGKLVGNNTFPTLGNAPIYVGVLQRGGGDLKLGRTYSVVLRLCQKRFDCNAIEIAESDIRTEPTAEGHVFHVLRGALALR